MIERVAYFSDSGHHRFLLTRKFNNRKPASLWVMMNPSRANQFADDATTRYAMNRTFRTGFGIYEAVNLWPVVDTYSESVAKMTDLQLFGLHGKERTNRIIIEAAQRATQIVVAWGAWAGSTERAKEVLTLLKPYTLWCLGVTQKGHPRFPRAVPHSRCLQLFRQPIL